MSRFNKMMLIVLGISLLGAWGCGEQRPGSEDVPGQTTGPAAKALVETKVATEQEPLKVCVGSMISPKEGFRYYKKILDYIGKKLDREIKYVDKTTYAELNEMIKTGKVDVGFVCSQPYVDGHRDFGMELLVAPQAYGETVYYSYIIVPKDSPAKSLEDLRGKTFAFTDPDSNSGKLVPTYMLSLMGETPDSFFGKYVFSYAHDKSIQLVAAKAVDGAAVDHLVWEYWNRFKPEYTERTRVLQKSDPYGIPPVVVPRGMDEKTKEQLREIFLNMHLDPAGKDILAHLAIDKFVLIEDSAFDTVREMQRYLEGQITKQER